MAEPDLRVLIVDDDARTLDLVERTLRADGFEVMACSSPLGVTNLIMSFMPRIVLVDVHIPALSGDQLIAISRKWAPPSTLFVLYSASDEGRLRGLAREVGADGWISKSVTGSDLTARLRQYAQKA